VNDVDDSDDYETRKLLSLLFTSTVYHVGISLHYLHRPFA